jgi:hypothetical protein
MPTLDVRKEKILYAIIQNYQESGEPVGTAARAYHVPAVGGEEFCRGKAEACGSTRNNDISGHLACSL